MFLTELMRLVGTSEFTFHLSTKGENLVLLVIPKGEAPDAKDAVAQAHVALAMPLRIEVPNTPDAERIILEQMGEYMAQRKQVHSNLDILNKVISESTKAIKQETKNKESAQSKPTDADAPKSTDTNETPEAGVSKRKNLDL